MPLYCYECPKCVHHFDNVLPMRESGQLQPCPHCGTLSPRDLMAEAPTANSGESPEQYSEAAGVHPNQIAECKARFPHHDFTTDGRMIFRGQRHKDRCLKDIGFVEHDKR